MLARFYGIVIRMYFLGSEHNLRIFMLSTETTPPLSIFDRRDTRRSSSVRAAALVREWMSLHAEELLRMWETQEFEKIDSLE